MDLPCAGEAKTMPLSLITLQLVGDVVILLLVYLGHMFTCKIHHYNIYKDAFFAAYLARIRSEILTTMTS